MTAVSADTAASPPTATGMARIIFASSLGTVFEYYDFLLYGSLAAFFGVLFFPPGNDMAALLGSLATFGAGFAVRPLGALLFGRLGDSLGRKATFQITIVLMGMATALVGILPTFAVIGWWAPALLVTLRMVQGLALGGEYGGATLYIAEHAPAARRGYYSSWIQTNGTMGFILSLVMVSACRAGLGDEAFRAWGWRIPFLASVALLLLSIYVRSRLAESPLFAALKAQGGLSAAPIAESLGRGNWRRIGIALIVAAPMALTWYTAQFYSLVFMQTALRFAANAAAAVLVMALLAGIPLYLLAGHVSDRLGRRPVMLAGMLLFTLLVMPCYRLLQSIGNPGAGHSTQLLLALVILAMVACAALTCAPGAALLAELFPTRIRYTSLSLPYHLTSAWFGGFMPLTATWLVARSGNIFAGLWYPIVICGLCFVLACWLMPETRSFELTT
jgi:MFS family permease